MLKIIRFVSLLFTGLALGGAFGHLLEMSNKLALDKEEYLFVQQRLYEGFGRVLGNVELGALVSTILVLVLVRKRRGAFLWTLLGAVLIVAALAVWQIWVGPVNTEVDAWTTVASMPANWGELRSSWEYGHAARAVLFAGAFVCLLVAVLDDTPSEAGSKPARKA